MATILATELTNNPKLTRYLAISASSKWGGAVALLAYIGAVASIRMSFWPYLALASFMFGLILVGFTYAFNAHNLQKLQNGWNKDVGLYHERQVTWAKVIKDDKSRVDCLRWVPWTLGWTSFLSFLFGVSLSTYKIAMLAQ